MAHSRYLFLAFMSVSLLRSGLVGQGLTSGAVAGRVTDADGKALFLVAVEATSPNLLGRVKGISDSAGRYHLVALPPGIYRISFSLRNHKTVIREGVRIESGEYKRIDIVLPQGASDEKVSVVGPTALIMDTSTSAGTSGPKAAIMMLPRGRNYDSLATIVPGVHHESLFFGGDGLTVEGASSAENLHLIDGTNITTTDRGTRGQEAAFEFADEVRIMPAGSAAELGGPTGGVVSVVTRQGGNEFHGEVIGYYEGSALTGKGRDTLGYGYFPYELYGHDYYFNYEELYGKEKWHRVEAGFALGGYVLKDKLWFFGSVLPVYWVGERTVDFLSTPEVESDLYETKEYKHNFMAKLSVRPVNFLRFGASFLNNFSRTRGILPPRDAAGSLDDVWREYGWDYPDWTISGFADLTIGSDFALGLKGGKFYSNTTNQQVQPVEPRWYLAGYGTHYFDGTALQIPDEYSRPRYWANRKSSNVIERNKRARTHLAADVVYFLDLVGEHVLKSGLQWIRLEEDVLDAYKFPFSDITFNWGRPIVVAGINYGMGVYGSYSVAGNEVTGTYGTDYSMRSDRWAVYLQDSWTVSGRFTLHAGLRAESEFIPPFTTELPPRISKDFKPVDFGWGEKLAPRIGFVYDVSGDGGLKFSGSYGLYYDAMKTHFAASSYGGIKRKIAYYTLDTYEWNKVGVDGYYPGTLALVYDWGMTAFETTDPNLKPMSQQNISLGAEKRLSNNLSLSVRFVQNHLRYAIEDIGVQVPGAGVVFFLANPGYGDSLWTTHGGKMDPAYPETPRAKREYTAVTVSLDKRLAGNWLAGVSYTWSQLAGNYSGLASSDERGEVEPYLEGDFNLWSLPYTKSLDPIDGPLPTDRTHCGKFYAAFTFPFRLTIGTVVNAMSGTPVTEAWLYQGAWHYPYGRGYVRAGDSANAKVAKKRTPFLLFANFYADYSLKLGKTSLQLSVNIDNAFDIATARDIYSRRTYYPLLVSEEMLLSGDWDLSSGVGYERDPFFLLENEFCPPISVRLGAKFIF